MLILLTLIGSVIAAGCTGAAPGADDAEAMAEDDAAMTAAADPNAPFISTWEFESGERI